MNACYHLRLSQILTFDALQGESESALQEVRSGLALISMAAKQQPQLVADHLPLLLKVRHS